VKIIGIYRKNQTRVKKKKQIPSPTKTRTQLRSYPILHLTKGKDDPLVRLNEQSYSAVSVVFIG
jgi:hypothetical protein